MEEGNNASHPSLCKNGCGFYGSPHFDGLCSLCHKDLEMEHQKQVSLTNAISNDAGTPRAVGELCSDLTKLTCSSSEANPIESTDTSLKCTSPVEESEKTCSKSSRSTKPKCQACNKRLGIVEQYVCHCEAMFCTRHRFPEEHNCTYDYKQQGRAKLETAIPKVEGPKVNKI